jgi:hypothetical protein
MPIGVYYRGAYRRFLSWGKNMKEREIRALKQMHVGEVLSIELIDLECVTDKADDCMDGDCFFYKSKFCESGQMCPDGSAFLARKQI